MTLADVVHQGQQPVLTFFAEWAHRGFDLDAPAVLGDERRLVAHRRLTACEPRRQLLDQHLALIGRRQLDQGLEGGELGWVIPGELLVGCVAGDEAAVLGDDHSLADVADGVEQRRLALRLHHKVAVHDAMGDIREQSQPKEDEGPRDHLAEGDVQHDRGVDPQRSEARHRNREQVREMTGQEAQVEIEKRGGEHRGREW